MVNTIISQTTMYSQYYHMKMKLV